MSTPVGIDLSTLSVPLGVLAIRGPDAANFLQGQLSADIEKLGTGSSTLAGFHNPQGRVIALLALVRAAPDAILAVLPRELIDGVIARLRKFLFRSKVKVDDESAHWTVIGTWTDPINADVPTISWGDRRILLVPAGRETKSADGFTAFNWEHIDVASGMPQVFAASSEAFVAQMLNLDLLGAISFEKGCYTGQEIIARTHFRGRVKRRMQKWWVDPDFTGKPGDTVRTRDGRSLAIVRIGPSEDRGRSMLAVGTYGANAEGAPAESAPEHAAGTVKVAGPHPLPYPLPE